MNREIPNDYKTEDMLFKNKPRQQNASEDIQALSRIMVQHNLSDPKDALAQVGDVDHWSYLKEFRPRYLRDVCHEAAKAARILADQFKNHPEKFPLPPPPQGGGAGGPPGGAAAGSKGKEVFGTYVLPDGTILVKEGDDYLAESDSGSITFYSEAGPQAAMKIAMIRLAAKGKPLSQRN